MDEQQKERLEQELRFLKESLEADVISKDEYERGKERLKRKLKELEEQPKETEKKPEEEPKTEEKEEIKEEPKIEIREIPEQPTKIIGVEEEKPEEPEKEETKETEEKPEEEEKEELEELEEKEKPTVEEKEPEEEEIKISKKWLYGISIIIIALILFFSIRGCKSEDIMGGEPAEPSIEEFTPECSSDYDCKQEGMVGTCLNPNTKEAKCEFKQDIETSLVVINDKACKLCDTSNTKTIIKEIFPNANINEIDYKTEEAKNLTTKLNINALPAYIFDSNVSKAINFDDFSSALIKKENSYIITNTASGANYYFKRALIENKLDLYILPGENEKIEASVQEVLLLFKDKINFTKQIVTEGQKAFLEKELAINTFPTFLLNNQIKFRGILPADVIKEKICQVNYFEECEKELSKI